MNPNPISDPPTERQAEVLNFIRASVRVKGPTVREVMRRFGFRSPNSVTGHVDQLVRRGLVTRDAGEFGGILPAPEPGCCPHCRRPFDAPAIPPEVMS